MSLIFWDQYLDLDDIKIELSKVSESVDQKNELTQIIDELIHARLINCVLENLDHEHHQEFLVMFTTAPHDDNITEFLKTRIKTDFSTLVKLEIEKIKKDIASLFNFKN